MEYKNKDIVDRGVVKKNDVEKRSFNIHNIKSDISKRYIRIWKT